MTTLQLPTYADVEAAAKRIEGFANRTPVNTSRTLNEMLGAEVFFKCENFQRMGAFKFRGAFNALAKFTPSNAVAAWSRSRPAITRRASRCPRSCWHGHDRDAPRRAGLEGRGHAGLWRDRGEL
jgi:threonine dehydratase